MDLKIKFQYFLIYISLTAIAVVIAINVWWTDPLTMSSLNKDTLALIASAGISWLGIVFLSIYIVRIILLKQEKDFISPLTLASEDFINRITVDRFKKFKLWLSGISFPLFFLTIAVFVYSMSLYKEQELKNGITQSVLVKEIRYDKKKNAYAHFLYSYGSNNFESNLPLKHLKQGDTTEIVFSKTNPDIVDYRLTQSKE